MKGYAFLSAIIIFFSGCAYQAKKISAIQESQLSYKNTQNSVQLTIKAVGQGENKSYFTNYTPLHIQIKNKSSQTYTLSAKNLGLQATTVDELRKKIPNFITSYFLPSGLLTAGGIIFWWQLCFPLAIATGITALVGGKLHKKNSVKKLKQMVLEPADTIKIKPYSQVNRLVFIKKENYSPRFTLKLVETKNNDELEFNVLICSQSNFVYQFS